MSATIDDTLGHLLVQVAKSHRSHVSTALKELGLYAGQELILLRLAQEDGPRQAVLAARLGIELPTLSRALGRMEQGGFVQRRTDPEDARATQVWLTPTGRAVLGPIEQIWRDVEQRMLSGVPDTDRAALRRMMGSLLGNLDQ